MALAPPGRACYDALGSPPALRAPRRAPAPLAFKAAARGDKGAPVPEHSADYFAPLSGATFIVLTTYRQSGQAVPTTVWFAEAGGTLYVTTAIQSGKARRIGANPQVSVAPSDRVGNVQGPALAARAHVLAPDEQGPAIAALAQKYADQYAALTAQMDAGRPAGSRIFIAITP